MSPVPSGERCGAMVKHVLGDSGGIIPCGLFIEGYGPCAECGLFSDYHQSGGPGWNGHPYQPSQWRHVDEPDVTIAVGARKVRISATHARRSGWKPDHEAEHE